MTVSASAGKHPTHPTPRRWRPPPPFFTFATLEEDADEILLAVLARDVSIPGFHFDPPSPNGDGVGKAWEHWAEHRQRLLKRDRMRWQAQCSAEWRQYREAVALPVVSPEEELRRRQANEAFAAKAHAAIRQEWLDLLQQTIDTLRADPRYRHLTGGMERDMATIREHPPGPLPWRLDRHAFAAALAALKRTTQEPPP